jgi:hypothetical protein
MNTTRPSSLGLLIGIGLGLLAMQAWAGAPALKEQLVGTWTLVGTEVSAAGSKPVPVDAPASGILVFTGDGRFAQIQLVAGVARAQSRSRVRGVEDDGEGATATESIATFGTYAVDDAARTVTYNVQSSTVAGWEGTTQTRAIQSVTVQELRLGGSPAAGVWKRANEDGR